MKTNESTQPYDNSLTMTTVHEGDKYVVYLESFPMGHFNTEKEADRYTVGIAEAMTGGPFIRYDGQVEL